MKRPSVAIVASIGCLIATQGRSTAQTPCLEWGTEFQPLDITGGNVLCSVQDPDPSHTTVYFCGTFTSIGGVPANHVVKWQDGAWQALGSGVQVFGGTSVDASAWHDTDGPGPSAASLYIGGWFQNVGGISANYVARWTGSAWQAVGDGLGGRVWSLCEFDEDGTGPGLPKLFAAGLFNGGFPYTVGLARLDGAAWTYLDVHGEGKSLGIFDGGGGSALYVGGLFNEAGGNPASCIVSWNGSQFDALGLGIHPAGGLAGVKALRVHDDGSGSSLYAAGQFDEAGGNPAFGVARWDGASWSAVGGGITPGAGVAADVRSLEVFDDGVETRLYAGGIFYQGSGHPFDFVASWDGTAWTELDGIDGNVYHLRTIAQADGTSLFVFGGFGTIGGNYSPGMGEWNGATWIPRGNSIRRQGSPPTISALRSVDLGDGPVLFAGGNFQFAGGASVRSIAAWSGSSWSPLGAPNDGPNGGVRTLEPYDTPSGLKLLVGGDFGSIVRAAQDSLPAGAIAAWDGSGWSAPPGLTNTSDGGGTDVRAMKQFDDGGGARLFVGGSFRGPSIALPRIASIVNDSWVPFASGPSNQVLATTYFNAGSGLHACVGGTAFVQRWNGSAWIAMLSNMIGAQIVRSLVVFDDGTGPALYAGGQFDVPNGGGFCRNVGKWNGSQWLPLGGGAGSFDVSTSINRLLVFDDGSGAALYAIGGTGLFRWNGATWTSIQTLAGFDATVYDPDGMGAQLPRIAVVGGFVIATPSGDAYRIATWDGSTWANLSSGLDGTGNAVGVFESANGPRLVVGGSFNNAGGTPATRIAMWDGSAWSAMGTGIANSGAVDIREITTFNDGSGPALYVGGQFNRAGFATVGSIAKWDGQAWSATPGVSGTVHNLVPTPGANPAALLATGSFTVGLAAITPNIAAWDDTSWAAVGDGFNQAVNALTVFDADGPGLLPPVLVAGGQFTASGSTSASRLAAWNGTSWNPLGTGVNTSNNGGVVYALTSFDDGSGPALYVGGYFTTAGGTPVSSVAKWNGSAWSGVGNGFVSQSGFPAAVLELDVFDDGSGPALYAGGDMATSGATTVRFLAKWDGSSWQELPTTLNGTVSALESAEYSGHPALYVGGTFSTAGGISSPAIARWGYCPETRPPPPPCDPDVNCDGTINGFDIEATEQAVNGDYSNFCQPTADLNNDGAENGFDIETEEQRVNGAPC
ncbi:hypothetical protein PHYC_00355 [Phycisphaerales bacterium]|nr:hypothetical protein PHYC_00355 [Phycisphaerales bacterium]